MTTTNRANANRENARKSTGPRSPAGKRKAAHNAFQHGLAVPVADLPGFDAEIAALAHVIAGADPSPARLERAVQLAEAQVDINRVRASRARMLRQAASIQNQGDASADAESTAEEAGDTPSVVPQLAALDRYERRALSRRKFAIRALDGLPTSPAQGRHGHATAHAASVAEALIAAG